jgi:hypothetical protein
MGRCQVADKVNEVSFHLDLTVDEVHRRAAVFEALGDSTGNIC